ncbi:hypothetical protein PYCCODRAFT_1428924 [Trametes coccinea BRFM310]|uniref:Uncharacterized protein n=1 Tax=Trametes coccinea (strain BRFM310) TaxID=1353009 RepID=A0A1Y2I7X9_TRAC3|nr:hypothetical protein PYCCODRAFT_1428924 [Trametes coccinea BRFM310]
MRYRSFYPSDDQDEMEDSYGFALDMDGILGASSPSRRVSFTTSSERDRPFIRPHPPSPSKRRMQARAQKALTVSTAVTPMPALTDSSRTSPSTIANPSPTAEPVSALSLETPRRPSTPVRPDAHSRTVSVTRPTTAADDYDDLPPSSPILSPLSSPLTSPVKYDEACVARKTSESLPPSSPIPIPRSPACSVEMAVEALDFTPSPPSPTLDALRITSRVSVRALLNPVPEPSPRLSPIARAPAEENEQNSLEVPVADEDVSLLNLNERSAEHTVVPETVETPVEAKDDAPLADAPAHSRAPSLRLSTPSRPSTPDLASLHDSLSSPLSSPPRSVADEQDVAIDIDIDIDIDIETEDCLPSAAISMEAPRSAASSRAQSVARSVAEEEHDRVCVPPRKKARREYDVGGSAAHAVPVKSDVVPRQEDQRETTSLQAPDVSKPVVAPTQKSSQKRRRTVVWSDDESDADADVPTPAPSSVPAPAQKRKSQEARARKRMREKDQDQVRERERTKKLRVKESGADVENKPLEVPTGPGVGSVKPQPAAKSVAGPAPPTSATNLTLPGPASVVTERSMDENHTAVEPVEDRKAEPKSVARAQVVSDAAPAPTCDKPKAARTEDKENYDLPEYTLPLPAIELEGMLIETLATSRASSLATSDLYGALMAARPALREMALPALVNAPTAEPAPAEEKAKEEKPEVGKKGKGGRGRGAKAEADAASRRAWVPALEGLLEAGWRRSGVFGKVVNCGTGTGDQELTLEARWFYDPDRDEDQERATLVRSMMRRPPKRSETKKAKQYYWRPLPKISRWDPEDEL